MLNNLLFCGATGTQNMGRLPNPDRIPGSRIYQNTLPNAGNMASGIFGFPKPRPAEDHLPDRRCVGKSS